MRASINNALLKHLPSGDVDIRDINLKGLVLRVRASGVHSYRVQYGRGKWLTLGSSEELKPAEARAEAKKVLGDAARGLDPMAAKRQAKSHTWKSYLNEVYAPWVMSRPGRRRAETVQRLRANFADLESLKLADIGVWHLDKHRSARLKAGIRPSTINRDVAELKSALTKAVQWHHVKAHPLAELKPLRIDKRPKVRFLSSDEHARLLEALAARDARIKAERERANAWRRERGYAELRDLRALRFADHLESMILVSLNTGLRRGELFHLRWADVNLPGRVLTVVGGTSKSGQTRYLPLNDAAFAALVAWRNQTEGQDLVFPNEHGRAFDNVNKSWRHLLKDAGITGFRWHDMRHDFASKLVMAGVPLNTVRDLLGHADLNTTLRYAHLAPDHKAEAVQRLCAEV
jgi:integrase